MNNPIQINNLLARVNAVQTEIKAATDRVIASGWYVQGQEMRKFESAFAAYIGVAQCVSLANGTDAIELGLKALGIQKGDVVATVANAGMYTTTAILSIGAQPLFMDVDIDTHNVTLDAVEKAIRDGAKAMVVTHLYGLAISAIDSIARLCKEQNIPLLEDCAQAHGAMIHDQRAGTFGDAASFSFYPTKNLGAMGDGGALVTKHEAVADRARSLRQYGWSSKYRVEIPQARNSRLDEIQAAILLVFLPNLDDYNQRRRKIANRYSAEIRHPHVTTPISRDSESVAHLYVVKTPLRESLKSHLMQREIATDVHYPVPDHRQPVFDQRYGDISLINTELLASQILTLPCYPEMSDEDVTRVVNAVISWQP